MKAPLLLAATPPSTALALAGVCLSAAVAQAERVGAFETKVSLVLAPYQEH